MKLALRVYLLQNSVLYSNIIRGNILGDTNVDVKTALVDPFEGIKGCCRHTMYESMITQLAKIAFGRTCMDSSNLLTIFGISYRYD